MRDVTMAVKIKITQGKPDATNDHEVVKLTSRRLSDFCRAD